MKDIKDISDSIFFDKYNTLEKLLDYYNFNEIYRDYDQTSYDYELDFITIHINKSLSKVNYTKYCFSFPVKYKTKFGYDYRIINQDSEGYLNGNINCIEDDISKVLLTPRLY